MIPGAARRSHVAQLDVVRLGAFCAVIAVHSVDFTQSMTSAGAAGLIMVLQFGREVFFALTGFVLVHSAGDRPLPAGPFWRRRVTTVLVPYLAWSGVYELHAVVSYGPRSWSLVGWDLLTGGAEYHLYFLLVTLQLYVVFPLVLRAVRRTAGHALVVLGVVGAANVAWLAVLHSVAPPPGALRTLWVHAYELLPTYGVYVLAGCYAAVHRERIDRFVDRHTRRLMGASAAAVAAGLAGFVAQLGHRAPRSAGDVLQPAMVLVSVAAATVLYAGGRWWVRNGRPAGRWVAGASDISFGVYLAHPLVLTLLLDHGLGTVGQTVPSVVATVLAAAGCAAGSVGLSWAARRTPLSWPLTGRPRRTPVGGAPVTEPATVAGPGLRVGAMA